MSLYRYDAPLDEMRFVIEQVLKAPEDWAAMPALAEIDAATAAEVLAQAARFASERLQPLNAAGDRQGCRIEGGRVKTPDGFAAAWHAFVDGGWPALASAPAWGGQGLPQLLNAALFEMLVAANHAWTMYPGLLHGACETIQAHASDALKACYLPRLVSGEWLAAMALTEAQAGSDLGAVRTKAEPQADGSLAVTGGKIFISGGDHDLGDNIVHLVLCRLHDAAHPAPPGSKGLSLVLVPSVLPDGRRNALSVDGLERKMGIHGSATCVMHYEGATGWLIGEPHCGLPAMFVMMNAARLHVALQGLGHLEMATQNAERYAAERVQFKRPIVQQPAVRRSLDRLRVVADGLRVLMYRAAMRLDEAEHHPDPVRRSAAAAEASILTPVLKAFATEQGFLGASDALQVWGGYGYVADYGIEQTLRDARIAMIYEGTNQIQAIDLVQRKLFGGAGPAFEALLRDLLQDAGDDEAGAALRAQLQMARQTLLVVREAAAGDIEAPLRAADDLLAGIGHLLLFWAWAATLRARPDDALRRARVHSGLQQLLPQGEMYWRRAASAARPQPATD